jgi:hypothetical protein
MTSLRVIEQGRRLVFAADAVAFEPISPSGRLELDRKVRIMTRGLRCTVAVPALFDARRYGFYSVQLLSHKLLMRTMAAPLLLLAALSPLVWSRGILYRVVVVGELIVYGLGALGWILAPTPVGKRKLLAVPAYFCLMNTASLLATWNLVRGRRVEQWQPQRDATSTGYPPGAVNH